MLLVLLIVMPSVAGATIDFKDEEWSNEELRLFFIASFLINAGGVALGLVPEPVVNLAGETTQLINGLNLKAVPPIFTPPEELENPIYPNAPMIFRDENGVETGRTDNCYFKHVIPLSYAGFANINGLLNYREHVLGGFTWRTQQAVADVRLEEVEAIEACLDQHLSQDNPPSALKLRRLCDLPANNWGVVGFPRLYHLMSDAAVGLSSFTAGIGATDEPQVVSTPAGHHQLNWDAMTLLNILGDAAIPGILLAAAILTEVKVAKDAKNIKKLAEQLQGSDDLPLRETTMLANEFLEAKAARKRFKKVMERILDNDNPLIDDAVKNSEKLLADLFGINYGQWDLITEITERVTGTASDSLLGDNIFEFVSARRHESTWLSVYDVHPPRLAAGKDGFAFDATDFGGVRYGRVAKQLQDNIDASDACGRDFNLSLGARVPGSNDTGTVPDLLPLGETLELVWTITDHGPNPPVGDDEQHADFPRDEEGRYQQTLVQKVTVKDSTPPLLLAPAGKVLETDNPDHLLIVRDPETNQPFLAGESLGQPLVVDLADPEPSVNEDAPVKFPVGSRTAVRWTAIDASGNESEDFQLITVKPTGTNTAPQATSQNTSTLTAEPVHITLKGVDMDLISGVSDPLSFHIEANPEHGEFIAPLFPYFITDYRSHENSDDDDGLYEAVAANQVENWYQTNICENPDLSDDERAKRETKMRERIFRPLFVHVLDNGRRYVLDHEFLCTVDGLETERRISVFDKQDKFIWRVLFDQDDGPHDETFRIGPKAEYLEFTDKLPGGTSSEFGLNRCPIDPDDGSLQNCQQLVDITSSNFPDSKIDIARLSSAIQDPVSGLYYVNDGLDIAVLDSVGNSLGRLLPAGYKHDLNGPLLGGCTRPGSPDVPWPAGGVRTVGFGMVLDEERNLYIADSCVSRIHKFGPSEQDSEGNLQAGDYMGWMGKCSTSGNKACDEGLQRSKGFSCTWETCELDPGEDPWGSGSGQFDLPMYLAFDPNGLLYVADYFNLRVQRFGADGVFAGEAQSNENGVVSPNKPSFVLGNMPAPRALAVNSTQFFVTDRAEKFVHIFGTLPFKDITPESAVVTYVSKHDFHSATDSFAYYVSDGLAQSEPATVTVQVDRNFRRPVAFDDEQITTEDTPVSFQLLADDPDGLKDIDFNGLDTLSFRITHQPNHGSVTVDANGVATYQPEVEFFGHDRFQFDVNDGNEDSKKAMVKIEVLSDNDAPVVSSTSLPERIGQGLDFTLEAVFSDDTNYEHQATVDWGDGDVSPPGSMELDEDSGELTVTGTVLMEPAIGSSGKLNAHHVYESLGEHTITVCVEDGDMQQGCLVTEVQVETLSQLLLKASVPEEDLRENEPILYSVEVAAAQPSAGQGLVSEDVSVLIETDELLTISSVQVDVPETSARMAMSATSAKLTTDQSSCAVEGQDIRCELGDVPPGESRVINIVARLALSAVYNEIPVLYVQAESSTDSAWPLVETMLEVEVLADDTDTDGDGITDAYENANGLNPNQDDAGQDLDGDGLSNREEFEIRTEADNFDTDGDGLGDGAEWNEWLTDPLLSDTDGDEMPDGWEIEHDLDPFRNDSLEDADGDGANNLDEFLWDTDPNNNSDAVHLNVPALGREALFLLISLMLAIGLAVVRKR